MQDLHNHLMAQIEALSDPDHTGEDLGEHIKRAKALGNLAEVVIDNARLALSVDKHLAEYDRSSAGKIVRQIAAPTLSQPALRIAASGNGKARAK